jgi:F-type H+-transporting ATPase subunit a
MDKNEILKQYILHHTRDSHEWVLPFFTVQLPGFLSLHGLMLLICAVLLVILFGVVYRKKEPVPHGMTNLLEVFVVFVRDQIAIKGLGEEDGRRMAPLFCTFFFFILGLNLLGLIPIFVTATGNVNVTGALAAITLAFMIFGAIHKNGVLGFIRAFVPHGVPWPLMIVLTPLEFLSMFIRSFALMIRLFANMMAGHSVIIALLGLIYLFGWIALPSVLLAVGVYLLELFIAFLQAYIFTLLSAIFIGMVYHPAH